MDERSRSELIQSVLDGQATEDEYKRLRSLLETDPELFRENAGMSRLFDRLGRSGEHAPPPELTARLLAGIESPQAPTRPWGRRSQDNVRLRPTAVTMRWGDLAMRYALAFSLGLIVTAAGYELWKGELKPIDIALVSGTMSGDRLAAGVTERRSVDLDAISGQVSLHRDGTVLVLQLALDADEATEVRVPLSADARITGFASLMGEPSELALDRQGLRLSQEGSQRFVVFLEAGPNALDVEFRRDGGLLGRQRIPAPPAE